MFDIHFQVVRFEKRGLVQYGQQFAGGQPVVRVILKPRLQAANRFGSLRPAAINKPFVYARDFRHMRVRWNFAAGGQNEPEVSRRMFRQGLF